MEALMQHYKLQDFRKRSLGSPHLATGHGFNPLGPTAAQIAAFLYELFDTHGQSPLTIKGNPSSLAWVLRRTGMAVEIQAKTISDYVYEIAEA